MIKQGESLFIPFLNGEGVRDAHQKARTYKSIDACRKALKRDFDKVEIVEYAPVRHGEWKHETPTKDDGQKPFVCSECGLRHPRYGDTDKEYFVYCPWCGVKMDAKEDADENA